MSWPGSLSGHVALVTGGNAGIGYGLVTGLLTAGADVAIAARNETKTEQAAERLRTRFPDATVFNVVCDVADERQVDTAVGQTVERLGRLDSCFANAGITQS